MGFDYEISVEHNIYPNLTVYDKYYNGEFAGWEVRSNEGYVFYNANANNTTFDPDTMEEIPVTYYYTLMSLTKYYNWANFALVAVLRSSVDENYIFGAGNNHETV